MNRRNLFYSICFFLIIFPGAAFAGSAKVTLEMEYRIAGGKIIKKFFGRVNVSTLDQRGLWVVFRKEKNMGFPGIVFGGNLIFCNDPVERMDALELVVTVINGKTEVKKRSALFSKTRPMGSKAPTHNNIYHLLVLNNFVDIQSLPQSLDKKVAQYEPWEAAFFRTHRIAMNYAVRSDEQTRKYEKAFDVKARYTLPRLILVAEEWLDIPAETDVKSNKKSGGLFGGKMKGVGKEISGEKQIVSRHIPIYSIDVLLDTIEATGTYPVGFQTTRSIRNDILEGETLFHATGGSRKIITATTVFSQMQKNIISKNSGNHIISINSDTITALNKCEHIWPSTKKDILTFLRENKNWMAIISQKPVIFYSGKKPSYALYAWYKVHPQSGRMIGMLPHDTRGAFSDELAILNKGLLIKPQARKVINTKGGAMKTLFSQVAGMYVASAGVLDAVNLTIADPTTANLSEKEWVKFLSDHSLHFCQKFLEENAHIYDAYASSIGFWQGAMFITYQLGGTQAARECAYKAYESFTDKAMANTKRYVEEKFKGAKTSFSTDAQKSLEEELSKRSNTLNKKLKALERVNAYHDKDAKWEKKTAEYMNSYNTAVDKLKSPLTKTHHDNPKN